MDTLFDVTQECFEKLATTYCTNSGLLEENVFEISGLDKGVYTFVLRRYRTDSEGKNSLDAEQVIVQELIDPEEKIVFSEWDAL